MQISVKRDKPTELEKALSKVANKSPQMIRFYTLRLFLELQLGRALTKQEAKKLGWTVYNSFPREKGKVIKYESEKRD